MARTVWDTFRDREIFGFHGNTRESIDRALGNGFQRRGKRGDWLGTGFYFWLDAPVRALEWADDIVRRSPTGENDVASVLVVRLKCNEHWIDLLEQSPWFDRLRAAADVLDTTGMLPNERDVMHPRVLAGPALHKIDYVMIEKMINDARRRGLPVDAVRAAFVEGTVVARGSALLDKAHVQIAVRNPNIIMAKQVLGREDIA